MDAIYDVLSQGFMITGFVMIMMMVIEYLNVLTDGNWDHIIAKWKTGQSLLCSFLGATPGCLGAYAAGSLYVHRVIGLGALTAAMVATCGDESFVMLTMFPRTALYIFGALFIGGVITGVIIDFFVKSPAQETAETSAFHQTSHPENPRCTPFSTAEFSTQWRNCSPQRGWLTLFLVLFLGGIVSGTITHGHHHGVAAESRPALSAEAEHHHQNQSNLSDPTDPTNQTDSTDQASSDRHHSSWNWLRITFLVLSLVALAIVVTVPDHFLDEHLWHHLIKVHGWRILLWTIGALAVTHIMVSNLEITTLVENHKLPILLIACLVGILPTSGPHMIFVTLYASQTLPLSVLLANCIVQDGHGLLPTLAHSRKTFLFIKGVKLTIGLAIGLLGHSLGW